MVVGIHLAVQQHGAGQGANGGGDGIDNGGSRPSEKLGTHSTKDMKRIPFGNVSPPHSERHGVHASNRAIRGSRRLEARQGHFLQEPVSSAIPRACAPLMVAAASASAGVIRICVQASEDKRHGEGRAGAGVEVGVGHGGPRRSVRAGA